MRVFSLFITLSFTKLVWSLRLLMAGSRLCTKLFLNAIRYWRVLEFPYTLAQLPTTRKLDILDISSPKLLAFYLAKKYHHHVTAIDIWEKEIALWKEILRLLGNPRPIADNLRFEISDARALSFANESFDVVYSICVIEHIDGNGDSLALQEVFRVLKDGGIAVVTVPFDKEGYDVYKNESVYHKAYESIPVFYERWYNWEQLQRRLITASGLELVDFKLAFEKHLRLHHNYIPKLLRSNFLVRNFWNVIEPLVAVFNLSVSATHEGKKEGIALLTLRKPSKKNLLLER